MIIASRKNHAAASTGVRSSVRVLVACYLLGGAFSCALAGQSDQYGQGRREEAPREQQAVRDNRIEQRAQQRGGESRYVEQRQAEPGRADPGRAEPRQPDSRQADPGRSDPRAYDNRRAQPAQDPGHADVLKRNSRMTPDERRDLRRQINEAGQDIYATPPRR